MTHLEVIQALRSLSAETGSLLCLGCEYEHNCGIHGCAIMRTSADLLEQLTAEPPNEPLTLEELRGMDGEPVWVEFVGKPDGSPIPPLWMLVDVGSKQLVTGAEFVDWREESWFAYRRKPAPEEGEQHV